MKDIKNHIIFEATGKSNSNGHLYPKDMKININQNIPITFKYEEDKKIGYVDNIKVDDGKIIADLHINKKDFDKLFKKATPGIMFRVQNPIYDSKKDLEEQIKIPVKEVELISIGMIKNNIDKNIKQVK